MLWRSVDAKQLMRFLSETSRDPPVQCGQGFSVMLACVHPTPRVFFKIPKEE